MSESWVLGFICGLVAVVVVFRFLARKLQMDDASKTKYDERQLIERGKGYRYAFFSYVIFNVFFFVFSIGSEIQLPTEVILISGILVACAVHVIYCIFHEAYWGLNNNIKNYIRLLIVAWVLNLAIGLINGYRSGWRTQDGMGEYFYNFVVAIFLAVVLIAMLIKWIKDKREVE